MATRGVQGFEMEVELIMHFGYEYHFATENDLLRSLNLRTEWLCTICNKIDRLVQCGVIHNREEVLTREIESWWEVHKRIDEDRREKEVKAAEAKRAEKVRQYEKLKNELGL